jgi:RND family efflux transporter MFP subunit
MLAGLRGLEPADRGAGLAASRVPTVQGRRWPLPALGLAATALAAAATFVLVQRPADAGNAPPVSAAAAVANALPPAPPAHGATEAAVLEASGFVVASRQATVSASITGRITRVHVKEGALVRRGDLIAELDNDISSAQVAYAQAGVLAAERAVEVTRRRLATASRTAARDRDLAAQGFISGASLDQSNGGADALQAQLEAELSQVEVAREQQRIQVVQKQGLRVRAPFDGIVVGVAATEGEVVSPMSGGGGFTRTGICTIVDLSSLEGEVDVSERHLGRIRAGQSVTVKLPAYPALSFEGKVVSLPSSIDRNTAAARVRIVFVNPGLELRPGLRADFSFKAPAGGA